MHDIVQHRRTSVFSRAALAAMLAAGAGMSHAHTIHIAIDMPPSANAGTPLATTVVGNMAGFDRDAFIGCSVSRLGQHRCMAVGSEVRVVPEPEDGLPMQPGPGGDGADGVGWRGRSRLN